MDAKHYIEAGREIDFTFWDETTRGVVAFYPHRAWGSDYVEVYMGDRDVMDEVDLSQACLLSISAGDIDYVYSDDEDLANEEALMRADALADEYAGRRVEESAPAPSGCEACGSGQRFLLGIHCMACGHDQGTPIQAGAFSLGRL